jgi:signal transduction histidine kinase/DNA-binding response OmpR family regulator
MSGKWLVVRVMCLVATLFLRAAGADTVVIEEGFESVSLGKHLELAYDAEGTATIDDVLAGKLQFAPSTKDVPNFGYRGGAEWARVWVRDTRASRPSSPLVIEHRATLTDRVVGFVPVAHGAWRRYEAGDQVPIEAWTAERERFPAFYVQDWDEARPVFFRVDGESSRPLAFLMMTPELHRRNLREDTRVQSVYFGALFAMAFYNALLALTVRSRAYVLYVGYLASYAFTTSALGGWGVFVGCSRVVFINYAVPFGLAFVGCCSLLFSAALLGFDRRQRLGRATEIYAVAALVSPFVAALHSYTWSLRTMIFGVPGWSALLIAMGWRRMKEGSDVARAYLVAWSMFILGTALYSLKVTGVIPSNALTTNAMQGGSFVEFLLLSLALAARIKSLQAQSLENAQRVAVLASKAEAATAQLLAEQERTNDELKRVDKLKDEFLANTSHELRTPLHGILGLTEGVLRTSPHLEASNRDRLEMVVASGRRLASLVNDILDFSKLRHQSLILREKDVDLRGAVSLAFSVLSPAAEAKALVLVNEVPTGARVYADESRLQQVLTNLIGNAVKFTSAGSVRVGADREGARVLVSVQDTGVGISPEAQGRIFESFEQGDGSTAREFGGTGLGLAVTKQLVELHGGTVRVSSSPGVGSTFTFDVAAGEEGQSVVTPGAPEEGGEALRGSIVIRAASLKATVANEVRAAEVGARAPGAMRLLVADDDPVNLEVLRAQLEPEGHEVVTARDGHQALRALYEHGPFDGVLLDVMMPGMTGPQAASKMRADYPHGSLPIVMLTAKNRPEDVVAGLKAGADDYVGKPFHREELLARLAVHLDASKLTRALERFVSSSLAGLAGEAKAAAVEPGQGRGRNVIVGRIAIHGLAELAARIDETAFFRRLNQVVHVLVEQVDLHGGVVETLADDSLCVLFESDANVAVATMRHAMQAAAAVAGTDLRLGAVLHAGHVNVGGVGSDQWVALRAMGESVLVAGALGRWGVARGFPILVTDAVVGRLDDRERLRQVCTARLGAKGHAVTVFEVGEKGKTAGNFDSLVEWLERGQFGRVQEALAGAVTDDPLVRHLAEAAGAGAREVSLT